MQQRNKWDLEVCTLLMSVQSLPAVHWVSLHHLFCHVIETRQLEKKCFNPCDAYSIESFAKYFWLPIVLEAKLALL